MQPPVYQVARYDGRMGKTLVTGATGFIGSHVARALAASGRRPAPAHAAEEPDRPALRPRVRAGDRRRDRSARGTPRDGGRRAGVPRRRAYFAAEPGSRRGLGHERARNPIVLESALEAEVERVVLTSSVAAVGVGKKPKPVDETATFDIGHLGITYVNSKHEAEVEALRLAARGLPVTIVNPSFVLGPDAPRGSSMNLVRRFIQKQIPAYVDGGLNIVDVRDVAKGHLLADKKGEIGRRYILSGRNFTFDRLFADLARISGVDSPRLKLPGLGAPAHARGRRPPAASGCAAHLAGRDPLGDALVVLPEHARQVGAGLQGAPARGDAPGRRQLAARPDRGRARGMSTEKHEVVLYRCPTPTNFLCPCGDRGPQAEARRRRVPDRARALQQASRDPRSRSSRGSAACRCWWIPTRSSTTRSGSSNTWTGSGAFRANRRGLESRPHGLYNVKRWIPQKQQ